MVSTDKIKEAQEWYAKERKITIGEFDDYDAHVCRVAASYHEAKVENLGLLDIKLSLPSDEDIWKQATNSVKLTDVEEKTPNKKWCKRNGFEDGAKWLKNKIKGNEC